MDQTISTLKIEIGASSAKAQKQITKLSKTLKTLRGTSTAVNVDTKSVDKAHAKVTKLKKLLNSLSRVAFYRMIRSALKAVTDTLSEGAENAYWYSKMIGDQTRYVADTFDNLSSRTYKMGNQLGAAWATLKTAIEPVLVMLINLVTKAIELVTQFFAVLAGKDTYLKATDYVKDWQEEAKGATKAAKEWKNQLLGFDEINRLEAPLDTGSGLGDSDFIDFAEMFTETPVNAQFASFASSIVKTIKDHLAEIEMAASGALLGVGLVLALTGANVPLGLGLMAVGAVGLAHAIAENWGWATDNIQNTLSSIEFIVSGLLLGMGAVLTFSGANVPLGIAMMAIGAAGMATAIALNWDEIPDQLRSTVAAIDLIVGGALSAIGLVLMLATPQFSPIGMALLASGLALGGIGVALDWEHMKNNVSNVLSEIMLVLGGALFGVGAILAFSSANIPLGIGLMIAGAVALGSAATLNWEYLQNKLSEKLAGIIAGIGAGIFAVGLLLALTGAALPLGIGMMIAGASAFASVAALKWDYLKTLMTGKLGELTMLIGTFAFVIGLMLALSGVALPLGIGLMILGGASAGFAVALNWGFIKSKLQGELAGIMAVVGIFTFAFGAVLAFSGAAIPLGIGLMIAGAAAVGGVAAVNWNLIVQKLKGTLGEIMTVVGLSLFAIGLVLALTGVALPLGLGLMVAGAATVAAPIAARWDQIAKDLEGPLGKIMLVFGVFEFAVGLLLTLTGVATPLGIGLMIAGGATVAAPIAAKWNSIPEEVQNTISRIMEIVGISSFAIGLLLFLTGVGAPLGLALMLGGAAVTAGGALINPNWGSAAATIQSELDSANTAASAGWGDINTTVSTESANMENSISTSWGNMQDTVSTSSSSMLRDVQANFTQMGNDAAEAAATMQNAMDFEWSIPNPNLPYIDVYYETVYGGDAPPVSVPRFNMRWFARGGVINNPTLFGMGEAGAEAIVPLERNTRWITNVANEMNAQRAKGLDGRDIGSDLEDANGIVVSAIMSAASQIVSAMSDNDGNHDFDSFVRQVTKVQRRQARATG